MIIGFPFGNIIYVLPNWGIFSSSITRGLLLLIKGGNSRGK